MTDLLKRSEVEIKEIQNLVDAFCGTITAKNFARAAALIQELHDKLQEVDAILKPLHAKSRVDYEEYCGVVMEIMDALPQEGE